MAAPDIEQLKNHLTALFACDNFYDFQRAQIRFVDLLISLLEKEDDKLKRCARTILGIDS